MLGFYRIAAAVPKLKVADIKFNTSEILCLIDEAEKNKSAIIVFPELCITGYTCADLFNQSALINSALSALEKIIQYTKDKKIITVVGLPCAYGNSLYNCAAVIQSGQCLGIVPKTFIPDTREFYEKRWFASAKTLHRNSKMPVNAKDIPLSPFLIFSYHDELVFSIEICEDLWTPLPPSSYHSAAGALVCLNLSASDELVTKAEYRKNLVKQQSARCVCGYVYTSASVHESTTDLVFAGHAMICENGAILTENQRFNRKSHIIYADIDMQKLKYLRRTETSMPDILPEISGSYQYIALYEPNNITTVRRNFSPFPFVPSKQKERDERCREIFAIQSAGLAKRIEHTGAKTAVIGISGGLDSTLAILVIAESFRLLKKNKKDIIAVRMPGFGTTSRTFENAANLCKQLGVTLKTIDIREACIKHFEDIEHNINITDVTYENVQARERTQILMDIANKTGGLVIGTGDMSEIALGWSTYNGDHMSMYAVNSGVPKTLIRYLIQWVADNSKSTLKKILNNVIDTPVTPELLPADSSGNISQKTEDIIGPYELHDFFLYHTIKYGASPEKILFLANQTFKNKYTKARIRRYLAVFIQRFFNNQFKRSCIPDGPKVGTISLSPRGDWRMPSDAVPNVWLDNLSHKPPATKKNC